MAKNKECPSCAMEVGSEHDECPICGYEFPDHSNTFKLIAVLLVVIFLLFFLL